MTQSNAETPLTFILANLNLVVPVAAATLVIIIAIIVICVMKGKSSQDKGEAQIVPTSFHFVFQELLPHPSEASSMLISISPGSLTGWT